MKTQSLRLHPVGGVRLAGAFAIAFLLSIAQAGAQVTTADILGRVNDPSGGVLAGATVIAENLDLRVSRTVQTNSTGDYLLALLPIGRYKITVTLSGFKSFTVPSLAVAAGDRARVDAQMEVGAVSEKITVEAQVAALQTDSATVGALVTQKAVQDLPLNGRNYINLVELTPGAGMSMINSSKSSGLTVDERRPNQAIAVGAQQSWVNNFLLDGLDNNDRIIGSTIVRPSVEALETVRVVTTQYAAELGRAAGGVVGLTTKSGTNTLHGSLFEYFRNDRMDAKNFQFTPAPKPEYRLNQFGGSAGGPLRRDRTFWFTDYEASRMRQGLVAQGVSVPTLLMKQGIFTESGLNTIYDPGTFVRNADNTTSRQPFAGNTIPKDRINPIAAKYMELYPAPKSAGIVNNFASAFPKKQDSTTFDGKIDHHINEARMLFGRYSFNDTTTFVPGDLGEVVPGIYSGGTGGFPGPAYQRAQGIHLNYVEILRPSLLMELKAGFARYSGNTLNINYGKNISQQFGIPGANHDLVSSGLTTANPSSYDSLGETNFAPLQNIDNVFQYQGALTWTRGSHTVKAGAALIRRQFTPGQSTSPRGTFSFDNNNTNNTSGSGGNSIASFLLGYPSAASMAQTLVWQGLRVWEPGAYIQDDWRVTSSLTLNLGVRWDLFTPFTEVNNLIANLNMTTAKIEIAGQNGVSRSAGVNTYYKNFAPRLGFAQTLGKTLVLRGGYGISYFPGQTQSQATLKNPPFIASWSQNVINNVPVSQMYSVSQGFPAAVPVNPNNITGNIAISATDYNFRPTMSQNFSLSLQKEIAGNVLGIGYVGALTRHNMQSQQMNQPLPAAPGVNVQTSRPYYGRLPGVANIGYMTPNGSLNYHSMQTTFERRLRAGLIVNANWTWAHAISSGPPGNGDPRPVAQLSNNYALERANSSLDIRHRATLSANYQLPFGKGLRGVAQQLAANWQLNAILVWQTGMPFTVTHLTARTNIATDRPNRIAAGTLDNPTLTKWFDTSAFAAQSLGSIGTSGVNILRGPHMRQLNLSLFKEFHLREALRLQFRIEAYDLSNTPNFGLPTAAFGNPSFGAISTLATGPTPRQLQLALKLLF
jgi:hypothetical protein